MIKHPLEDLIENYLFEKDITFETRAFYKSILKQYLNYIKSNQILYATTEDVIKYIDTIRSKGFSSQWIHHQITVVKGLYQYLSLNQARLDLDSVYKFDITESMKNIKIERKLSKSILTAEQAKHLILYLKDHRKYSWHYRDYAIIYVMMMTGLRSIEIRRARIKDLKMMNEKYVLYVHGKGRSLSDEFVNISNRCYEAIMDYLNVRKDKNPYLFVSRSKRSIKPMSHTIFNGIFKRILKDSKLTDTHMTAHLLRHTAASFNLERGGSLESTKKLLRHTQMSNTRIYTHVRDTSFDETVTKLEDFILDSE